MLREIRDVRQVSGEPMRRWFSDEDFDLIVWLDPEDRIIGSAAGKDFFFSLTTPFM